MSLVELFHLLRRKRALFFVSCVALLGGLFSYFYLKRRLNNTNPNSQTDSGTSSSKAGKTDTTFPRLRDLTRRTVVSLSTVGTLVEASGDVGSFHESNFKTLCQVASKADLYLITRCDDTATYERVHKLLQQNGVFQAGLNPNKHLACSTVIGKAHIVRQLEASIHIDGDEEVIHHLQRFTPHLLLISKHEQSANVSSGGGTVVAASVHQQFNLT